MPSNGFGELLDRRSAGAIETVRRAICSYHRNGPFGGFAVRVDLVQQQHDRTPQPAEDLELGVDVARLVRPLLECWDRIRGIGSEEPAPKVAVSISGDDGVEDVPPAISAVGVAFAQGAAFQHAELVEQEVRVVAAAVEMAIPGGPFLIAVGGADRAVHIQNDILQPGAVMKPVDPLPAQIGQRCPVLGQGQRFGFEPPHLGSRGRLRIDCPTTDNLTHDRIEGQPIRVVDILVTSQPPEHRLPKQPLKPVARVLPTTGVT